MKESAVLFLVVMSIVTVLVSTVQPATASSDSWIERAPMPTGRRDFGAATVNGMIYAIGGLTSMPKEDKFGRATTTNVNEAYDPATDAWIEKAPMLSPHWLNNFGIAVCQNKIYCIGGPANNVYDPATDTWEAKTPMPTSRHFLSANVIDDKIYLIGGLALGPPPAWQDKLTSDPRAKLITYSRSSLTEVYDPLADSWTEKAPIPTAVDSYASAVVDNKIYIMSGRVGGDVTGLVQVYDPRSDKWSLAASIPHPVADAAAGAITDTATKAIYVVGGYFSYEQFNGSSLNQVYFPENDSWTMSMSMPVNRFGLSVAIANDKLYAIGGAGETGGYMETIYQYTPAETTQPNSTQTPSESPSTPPETQNNPILPPEIAIATGTTATTITISVAAILWKKKNRTK